MGSILLRPHVTDVLLDGSKVNGLQVRKLEWFSIWSTSLIWSKLISSLYDIHIDKSPLASATGSASNSAYICKTMASIWSTALSINSLMSEFSVDSVLIRFKFHINNRTFFFCLFHSHFCTFESQSMILFTVFLFSFTDRLFLFVFLLDKVTEHVFLAIGGPLLLEQLQSASWCGTFACFVCCVFWHFLTRKTGFLSFLPLKQPLLEWVKLEGRARVYAASIECTISMWRSSVCVSSAEFNTSTLQVESRSLDWPLCSSGWSSGLGRPSS